MQIRECSLQYTYTCECGCTHAITSTPPHSQVILELGANEGTDVLRVVLDRQLRVVFEILPSCTCDRCKVAWSRYICKSGCCLSFAFALMLPAPQLRRFHLHRSFCCPYSSCGFGSLVAVLKPCICALVCARARVRGHCPWQQRVAASLRMVARCGGA